MNKLVYHEIDKCKVRCMTLNDLLWQRIEVFNPTNKPAMVDLSKLRFKINNWYYYIPYALYVEPGLTRSIEVVNGSFIPVDNLTFVEELAKEKNLV